MILSTTRITTSSTSGTLVAHVWRGAGNEQIMPLRGTVADIDDAFADAQAHGAKYAIRHYSINPSRPISREQAIDALRVIAAEFGFDPTTAVVVEHAKRRHDNGAHDRHWHVLIPEVDIVRGRVIDAHHLKRRNEKCARMIEASVGEPYTKGRHNRAVVAALRAEGNGTLADSIVAAGLTDGPPPASAYTAEHHQAAKRKGMSMPAIKATIGSAWKGADSTSAFVAALQGEGLSIANGDKANVWIVTTDDGQFVGALHRLVHQQAGDVARRMATVSIPAPCQPSPPTSTACTTTPQEEDHGRSTAPTTPVDIDTIAGTDQAASACQQDRDGDQGRHRQDHRPADGDSGRRAEPSGHHHRTVTAGHRRPAAGMADAGRSFRRRRSVEKLLTATNSELARLRRLQAERFMPKDPDSYLSELQRQIAVLRCKAVEPPPIYADIVRADLARAAALARRSAADDRLAAIGYDCPPRWTIIPHLIWRYRRRSAEREVAEAHAGFDAADKAIGASAIVVIDTHVAATAQAAAEATRLEEVATALKVGAPRVRAAIRCRCDWTVIEMAAARDNNDRRAVEAAAKAAMEIKTHGRRAIASIPEFPDDPAPTFKPPWA